MSRRLILLLSAVLLPAVLGATEGGLPGAFLDYGPAPRSLALGKAFTGLADDAQAGYFNPGGLFQLNAHEVILAHSYLYGARMEYIGYALPTRDLGTVSLTLLNYGAEGLDSRTPDNLQYQSFAFAENAFMASYCYNPWSYLGIGANLKMVTKNVAAFSGIGVGVDVGALVTLPRPLSFGLAVQNLLEPVLQLRHLAETYPRTLKAGAAARLLDGRAILTADVTMPLLRDRDSTGNPSPDFTPRIAPRGGVEFSIVPGVLVQRVGLNPNEISLGLGIHKAWGKMGIGVDYAFLLHHRSEYRLAPTHKIGAFIEFAGFRVWIDGRPQVFSPTPGNDQNVLWMDVRVLSRAPVKRWQVLIKNQFGEVVRTFQGWDTPPLRLNWDGLDDVGRLVSDGRYGYEIVVVDERDSSLDFAGFLTEIRTRGPQGRIEIRPGE